MNETTQEEKENTDDNKTIVIQTLSEIPTIKPAIAESERFIQFLNKRFALELPNDIILTIEETRPNVKGFYRSIKCQKIWKAETDNTPFKQQDNKARAINSIVLSSHFLKDNPHETIAHEVAHFYNDMKGIKDTSKNGIYHNKKFKATAEKLLLKVDKDNKRGYAYTSPTDEFNNMLQNEFKPSKDAFKIFQEIGLTSGKKPSRLLLFMCSCGCKIRTARNEDKPLIAVCQYCNTEFKEV